MRGFGRYHVTRKAAIGVAASFMMAMRGAYTTALDD